MPDRLLPSFCGAATLLLGFALSSSPAFAGFKWVAPAGETPYSSSEPSPYAAPLPLSPIVAEPKSEIKTDVGLVSVPKAEVKNEAKVDLANETISITPQPAKETSKEPVVEGFASHVPLTLALRQLLPVGYTFSISPGVDMNTLVSYKSGRPWDATLEAMLAAVDLAFAKNGTVVTVMPAQGAVSPIAQKAPQSLPRPAVFPSQETVAASAPVVVPAADAVPVGSWTAERGSTLHAVLTDWCRRAGIELKWLAEYDYPIEASANFNRGFEDAVRNLLAGFDAARPQPFGELHVNASAGQKVLVVQTRGNSYSN